MDSGGDTAIRPPRSRELAGWGGRSVLGRELRTGKSVDLGVSQEGPGAALSHPEGFITLAKSP